MRIFPERPGHKLEIKERSLTELFAGRQTLMGIVARITPTSVFLRLAQAELEVPLARLGGELQDLLREGQPVVLHGEDGAVILEAAAQPPAAPGPEGSVVSTQTLKDALLALDIRPTEEAQLAAAGLLERGFPLQKEYLRALLPWAQRGKLEEALQLLQARFPFTPELVELVSEVREKPISQPLWEQAVEELPPELQEALRHPSLRSRAELGGTMREGRPLRALARLLAAERLIQFHGAATQGEGREFVFSLPFLKGQDLFASWVRIARDAETPQAEEQAFRLEMLLPTDSFGMVRAELFVLGRSVRLHLEAEKNHHSLAAQAEELQVELGAAGWQLGEVKVGELEPCARQSLYAMIAR